jgi:hypothetical protein
LRSTIPLACRISTYITPMAASRRSARSWTGRPCLLPLRGQEGARASGPRVRLAGARGPTAAARRIRMSGMRLDGGELG